MGLLKAGPPGDWGEVESGRKRVRPISAFTNSLGIP
jgi:hypothetical protein